MKLSAADSALLSARERDMLQSKGPWNVKDLVSLIKRVRDLRDKQRQLTQRQKISSAKRTGSKAGTSGAANARTAQKGRVFDRALKYFESQLDRLNQQSSAAAAELEVGTASATPAKGKTRKASNKAERKAVKKSTRKAAKAGATGATKKPVKKAAKKAAKKVAKKVAGAKAKKPAAAKKPSAKKAAKAGAKKAATKKAAGKATKKSATKKAAAKKVAAKKVAKKPVKKPAAKAAKAGRSVSKKVAARKVAKAAAARKSAARKGPVRNVSDKARLNLPKGPGGHVGSQVASLPSRNMRAKRAR